MRFCRLWIFFSLLTCTGLIDAQQSAPSSPPSAKHNSKPVSTDATVDPGSLTNRLYRNKMFGFTYKIPEGWVLRTDEMNAENQPAQSPGDDAKSGSVSDRPDEAVRPAPDQKSETGRPVEPASTANSNKVLLAAFSRPPEAKGEEVNSSVLIIAESAAAYPGLTDPAQYFGPLTEVAKAQGFSADEDPYEIAVGSKVLVRDDFHKDVGSRVMRQSTLAMLSHGYAVSFTVIGGTEDEVEELIDALDFQAATQQKQGASKHKQSTTDPSSPPKRSSPPPK